MNDHDHQTTPVSPDQRFSLLNLADSPAASFQSFATDIAHLPHLPIEHDACSMVCVGSLDPAARAAFAAFTQALEDTQFDPVRGFAASYDRVLVADWTTSSIADAARHVVARVRSLALESAGTLRIVFVGHDVGGLVAAEAARTFFAYCDARRGDASVAAWADRVLVDGVLALNAPFFLYPSGLHGAAAHAALLAYSGQLALPSKPRASSARRKFVDAKPLAFVSRAVVGAVTRAAMGVTAGLAEMAGLDTRWHARLKFLHPVLVEPFDSRVARIDALRARGVNVVNVATRVMGGDPETAVYVPPKRFLPDDWHADEAEPMMVYVEAGKASAGERALEAAETALDPEKRPEVYRKLVDACVKVLDGWARARGVPDTIGGAG
ncbi:hypothetical protein H9P43_003884 [Blastocladiella emersonii ATCC 22665]|nr:hypothetical protein H9P43_003884 [Blastocladiella emersonii ATCC 22665]